jgi:hypothetical protein
MLHGENIVASLLVAAGGEWWGIDWIWSRDRIADWEAEMRTQNGRLHEVSVDLSLRMEEVA